MTDKSEFLVVLFRSVHHVLASEKILKKAQVPHKIIPVPKSISSDCGVCIRFTPESREKIESLLDKDRIVEIRTL